MMDLYSITDSTPYLYPFGMPDESTFDSVDKNKKWLLILSKLGKFKLLEPDWDGEDGTPPNDQLIESLMRYLLNLREQGAASPDRVLATNDGSIIVEWQSYDSKIELESSEPGQGELMYVPDAGEPEFIDFKWEDTAGWKRDLSYTLTPGDSSSTSWLQDVA